MLNKKIFTKPSANFANNAFAHRPRRWKSPRRQKSPRPHCGVRNRQRLLLTDHAPARNTPARSALPRTTTSTMVATSPLATISVVSTADSPLHPLPRLGYTASTHPPLVATTEKGHKAIPPPSSSLLIKGARLAKWLPKYTRLWKILINWYNLDQAVNYNRLRITSVNNNNPCRGHGYHLRRPVIVHCGKVKVPTPVTRRNINLFIQKGVQDDRGGNQNYSSSTRH